ncbi:MAG TPA: adenylyltransferase/cytidyltransferase family protein [Steroidobacteraceae bacterium]
MPAPPLAADIPQVLQQKIIARQQVVARDWASMRPLVFTNGVFDLLHAGHVAYLAAARSLGQTLLVAVNTDASARRLDKGPGRPLNDERDRALVVAALESVSLVTWFDEDTPCELIARCRPDVYVKGGDYDIETLAETRLVRGWGGRSVAIPLLPGRSTSSLVQRIRGGD